MDNRMDKQLDRRSFLRGSSLFAGALGLGLVSPLSALAQQAQQPAPPKDEKKDQKKKSDPFREDDSDRDVLRDADGLEYRVCPQCGYNMYLHGRTWVCDNCGYSYVE